MKLKLYLSLLIFFVIQNYGFCAEISNQTISASLGEVLEISKIIVDNIEYDVDAPLVNVKKKNTTKSKRSTAIELSPIQLKIHTNLSTPISITAKFQELNHDENLHKFNIKDLDIAPNKIIINDPYDNVITDEFIPSVNVQPNAKKGLYTGQILFTLGVI